PLPRARLGAHDVRPGGVAAPGATLPAARPTRRAGGTPPPPAREGPGPPLSERARARDGAAGRRRRTVSTRLVGRLGCEPPFACGRRGERTRRSAPTVEAQVRVRPPRRMAKPVPDDPLSAQ